MPGSGFFKSLHFLHAYMDVKFELQILSRSNLPTKLMPTSIMLLSQDAIGCDNMSDFETLLRKQTIQWNGKI